MRQEDILGYLEWDTCVDVAKIWDKTRNEEEFVKLYSLVDEHETVHGVILEIMSDGMEMVVDKLVPRGI